MVNDKMKEMKCHINDEFYFFLNFLGHEKDFSASEIANVVRSWSGRDIASVVRYYWKYEAEWKEYLENSEKEADKLWEELKDAS